MSRLSTKPIPPEERLIVAVDVPGHDEALALVDRLGDTVRFYKLGLELAMSGRYFELVDALAARGKQVFADLKFHDIPNTVAAAVRELSKRGVAFATLHAGHPPMLEAACAEKGALRLLAVTVLTSVAPEELRDQGISLSVEELAVARAGHALQAGCDGVIASGVEAAALRAAHGDDFLIVSPGIRPAERADDQRRVVTPRQAFENGADYIVVGRPVHAAPDPAAAAAGIQATIAEIFG
ncbi:MAG: orotidine-5'-phosphate decarboxylase [Myxococcota bacterium]